jgi:hypothetical protein
MTTIFRYAQVQGKGILHRIKACKPEVGLVLCLLHARHSLNSRICRLYLLGDVDCHL